MNDSDFEGKRLSEQFGVGGPPEVSGDAPPSVRTVETVTLEIRTLQRQAQQVVLGYAIEIGRRLEEVKAMLPHGRWGDYLKQEVNYSQSTAQNFMRIFREYGASQQSLFGGVANSQALGNLTYTKALQLLALPDAEERERFVAEHDVEAMSTRELDKALKERDAALKEAEAAKTEADGLRLEAQHLQEHMAEAQRIYDQNLMQAAADADSSKLSAKHWQEAWENADNDLKSAKAAAATAAEEHARLLQELEELRSRPVDVAVEVDQEAVEAARQAAIAEMTEKVNKANDRAKKANEQRKNFEENLAAAQRELADLKAREPQVRELTPEELQAMTADAVEKARAGDLEKVKELEKKLAAADGDVSAFRIHYEAWQDHYNKLSDYLTKIASREPERAGKLRMAVKAVIERMAAG